ncbi:hypothetical protein BDZ45DRAFT_754766 [Acephala macrosclerotiorum]|nr:hypothetical protein BDZ45DRAFT_754766 [Acephala macrosclerotiorum]
MSLVLHLSSLPLFLPLALLPSLIGKTNGIPLSAENAIIHAVQPTCTTLQGGSTSCNVGINSLPSLITLDGGYEWLTVQPTTITESGSTLTTNEAVWTAVQTSYLDVEPVTTTATNGATTVSTSTAYVSFITTTTAAAGAAPTALIAAAIIAPALVATLQPIVDSAGGKTAEAIGSEIISTLAQSGVVLTTEEATQLGTVILAVGLHGAAAAANHLYQTFPLTPYIANINVAPNPPQNSATASPSSSTTSSAVETATAIVDPPYSDYQDYQVIMTVSGPTPTSDDLASSTSTALPSATAQCNTSNVGAAVEVVGALANKFCTGLDLSKDSSSTLPGSASGLQGADGITVLFNFSQTANTCALGCNASYAQIVTSCEFNSHTIYGAASLQDSCGTFAMSISSSAPATSTTAALPPPTPTLSPPVLQAQQCYGTNDFGSHSDIAANVQSSWASTFCSNFDQTFTSGTAAVKWNGASIIYKNGVSPYHYTVSWIDGCMTTATQQSMKQPLGPGTPTVNCVIMVELAGPEM